MVRESLSIKIQQDLWRNFRLWSNNKITCASLRVSLSRQTDHQSNTTNIYRTPFQLQALGKTTEISIRRIVSPTIIGWADVDMALL